MLTDGYLENNGPDADDDRPRAACPNCGTRNDPQYRYCRECVTRIA